MSTIRRFLSTFNRTSQEDPLHDFTFAVEIDGFKRFGFTKFSGIKQKTTQIKYREGNMLTTSRKSPGQTEFDDVTLERGVIVSSAGDDDFALWLGLVFKVGSKLAQAPDFRKTVDIVEFTREAKTARRHRLYEAWPSEGMPFNDKSGEGNNNAIESLVICYEGYDRIELLRLLDVVR